MPSKDHEFPLELFRKQPRLALDLLRTVCGIPAPDDAQVSLGSETYPDISPAEYRCDVTVMVGDPEAPSMGIVVESQGRYTKRKTFTWPVYLAALRARRECPVTLLVFCPDESTARACGAPIELGHPGWTLQPLIVSPERLPAITDPRKARNLPELTVLSAPIHADGPDREAVLHALISAIEATDYDTGALYHDYAASRMSAAAYKLLEEFMKLEHPELRSEFARRHVAEGEARGEAKSVLLVLAERDIEVSDEARERIISCTDAAQLELWLRRAMTVKTIEEVFV